MSHKAERCVIDLHGKMKNFSHVKITTITAYAIISGVFDPSSIFLIVSAESERQAGEAVLGSKSSQGDGDVYHIRDVMFKQHKKGKCKASQAFRNCTSVNMLLNGDKVNVKFTSNKLQMVGIRHEKDIAKIANRFLDMTNWVNQTLARVQRNKEHARKTVDFFYECVKGKPHIVKKKDRRCSGHVEITRWAVEYEMKKLSAPEPNWALKDLWSLLLCICKEELQNPERYYLSMVRARIEYILTLKSVLCDLSGDNVCCSAPLKLVNYNIGMMNFNYNLGYRVDRDAVVMKLTAMGIRARFDNMISDHAKIRVPDKYTGQYHTFLVYHYGAVTQSGPGGRGMREVYEEIIGILSNKRLFQWGIADRSWEENIGVPAII